MDGTLLRTDTLHEAALRFLSGNPLRALLLLRWLAGGKARLKAELAARAPLDAASLPYDREFAAWLGEEKRAGRKLVLCTAADARYAEAVAAETGLFDEVLASDGRVNLSGAAKARALKERFGAFDYAGDSSADLPVWAEARRMVLVRARAGVARRAGGAGEAEKVFAPRRASGAEWRAVFRVHQWLKNLLLFAPFFASHRFAEPALLPPLFAGFLAFSLCASAVYIINDLADLESDRLHPRKRARPFASGAVPVRFGAILAPLCLIAAFVLAAPAGPAFIACLAAYIVLTTAYSFALKRVAVVDCLVLACLYTLRIIAGAAAIAVPLSFWLLAFSIFLFLSLAVVKRCAELHALRADGEAEGAVPGRGWRVEDAPLAEAFGVAAGYVSVLIFALYLQSDDVALLYSQPEVLWGSLVPLLFWVSWMWLQTRRGAMDDDPILFAVRDKASLIAGAVFAAVFLFATFLP